MEAPIFAPSMAVGAPLLGPIAKSAAQSQQSENASNYLALMANI
jgi:hypothetical protein